MNTTARLLVALVLLLCGAVSIGQSPTAPRPFASRYEAFDLFIDSGAATLAAYQIDLQAAGQSVVIVGIEGGEPAPFKQPPYYDPKAMQHERVILAALSTAKAADLPTGRVRVARVHVQITGSVRPDWTCTLVTAGNAAGDKIAATAQIKRQGEDQ